MALDITPDSLAFYDVDMKYVVEPGEFEIMVGNSSRDADLQKVVLTVDSDSRDDLHMAIQHAEALVRRKSGLQPGRRRRELRLHDDDSVPAQFLHRRDGPRARPRPA